MNKTKIEWCDWTWNPVVGCSPVSEGCEHCYAAALSKRFGWPWGSAHIMPFRLFEPAKVKKPGRVFVCSMSDLGHKSVTPGWRIMVCEAMKRAPWHTYIVLTKRPGPWMQQFADVGAWVGVTCENQARADERITELVKIKAPVRFVSVEPMLEPVDLSYAAFNGCDSLQCMQGIDWVIAGPETGPGARECQGSWITQQDVDCAIAGVPFFDKRKKGWMRREWPIPREMNSPLCGKTGKAGE